MHVILKSPIASSTPPVLLETENCQLCTQKSITCSDKSKNKRELSIWTHLEQARILTEMHKKCTVLEQQVMDSRKKLRSTQAMLTRIREEQSSMQKKNKLMLLQVLVVL